MSSVGPTRCIHDASLFLSVNVWFDDMGLCGCVVIDICLLGYDGFGQCGGNCWFGCLMAAVG